MKRLVSLILALALVATAGCANMTTRQQQALSGGAIGAAGGVVIGAIAGSPIIGATVGAAVGAAAGALWEDIQKNLAGGGRAAKEQPKQ